jgi:hypothetical protein
MHRNGTREAVETLALQARSKGLESTLGHWTRVVAQRASYVLTRHSLCIVVHIPLVDPKKKMKARRLLPFRQMRGDVCVRIEDQSEITLMTTEGHSVRVENPSECRRWDHGLVCPASVTRRELSCVSRLQLCQVTAVQCAEWMKVTRSAILWFTPTVQRLRVLCKGLERDIMAEAGFYKISVAPGCQLVTATREVTLPEQVDVDVKVELIEMKDMDADEFFAAFDMVKAQRAIENGRLEVELEDAKSTWHQVVEDYGPHLHGASLGVGTLGLLGVAAVVLVVWWRVRKTNARRKALAHPQAP